MTDSTRLTHLLDRYATALALHLATVREEFNTLERAWAALSDVYEGDAADQIRDVFGHSVARMHHYETDADRMLTLLRARLETLRAFDAPHPTL